MSTHSRQKKSKTSSCIFSCHLFLCFPSSFVVPPDLSNWRCDYSAGGYALSLSWEAQLGEWSAAEANLTGRAPQKEISPNVLSTQITGLQPAKTYSISLGVLSGDLRSNPVVISCGTDPRGESHPNEDNFETLVLFPSCV